MDYDRQRALIESELWARLSANAKAVLVVLEVRTPNDTDESLPMRREDIAKEAGLSLPSARKGIREVDGYKLFAEIDNGIRRRAIRYSYRRLPIPAKYEKPLQCNALTCNRISPPKDNKQSSSKGGTPKPDPITFDDDLRSFIGITDADISAWGAACPAVDVLAELRKAAIWYAANPPKKNLRRFLTNWIIRAQKDAKDRPARKPEAAMPPLDFAE